MSFNVLDSIKMVKFSDLPDDIVHIIYKYSNEHFEYLSKWNTKKKKWNQLLTNRCYVCRQSSKHVALSHLCNCCIVNTSGVCKNELICWSCAH